MAIKIAVCDDELQAIRQIDTYLTQIQKETEMKFQVFYFASGEDLLSHMPQDINILLLDIQLSSMSGIEVARKLRERNSEFFLFFITSNTQYALEGYSVHAYAFLGKPIQYALLKTYLLEAVSSLRRSRSLNLEVKNGPVSTVIDCENLVYAEVYGHTSVFVLGDGRRLTSKMPLDKLEYKLNKYGFFRCHKSYLINLRKVSSIRSNEVVMTDGTTIMLSRGRKQEFLMAFHSVMEG